MASGGGTEGALPSATPSIDAIQDVRFRTTLRGYDMHDVDSFLSDVKLEADGVANSLLEALDRIDRLEADLRMARTELEIARRTNRPDADPPKKADDFLY